MKTPSQPLTIRLAPEYLKLLNEEAEKEGRNPSDCARRHLLRSLTATDTAELRFELEKLQADLREEIGTLQKDFRKLRGDLATLSLALLIKVAKEKPDDAAAWLRKNLAP